MRRVDCRNDFWVGSVTEKRHHSYELYHTTLSPVVLSDFFIHFIHINILFVIKLYFFKLFIDKQEVICYSKHIKQKGSKIKTKKE